MSTTAPAPFSGTLKLSTFPNRFNTVVPPEGPFYRTGFKLTSTGPNPRPLTEGLDYYLCYYFKEAAEALKDQVFGGIMLLTETEVNYTIYSVGREYRVPQSEIGKFLVKPDMKDPRNVDWSALMRYAPVVAPIDPPTNLAEAILRDEVVKALDDIRKGILSRASDMDTAYAEVTDLIFQTGKKIFDDNLYQHHLIKNAHEYTAEEVGALKVLQKAVDSTKAFGKSLDELTAIMKTNGIQQAHIDTLMPVVLGELRGRMKVLNNGALTFRTADSSHVITLQGDKFLITTTKPITITADADNNEPGLAVEVDAGLNAMYVASGADAPIFNGAYLVTPDMVSLYLSAVKLLPANAYFASTDTVKIFGSAKDYSPVTMNAVLPTASAAAEGLLLVTSLSTNIAAGAAISQKAVNALKKTLDNYVDNTYTVNGKGFVLNNGKQELTLTAGDIGLGNVQNTAPSQKPLTTAIINALKGKALGTHTHTFTDLTNVPTASDTDAGLVQLWDAIDNTTNKVVTSKQGYAVQQQIASLRGVVNTLLPAWTSGGSQYGNPGYLPVPAVGNYAGFTKRIEKTQMMGVIKQEGDTVYALRNGNDGFPNTDHIYFAYAQVDNAGKMVNRQQTSVVYQPEGMKAFPGVSLVAIVLCGEQAMVCLGSDGLHYTVMFDGTLNQKKHLRVWQTTFPTGLSGPDGNFDFSPTQSTDHVVVYNDRVYILRMQITNVYYRTLLLRGTVNGNSVAYGAVTLNGGSSVQGAMVNLRQPVDVSATAPIANGLSYVTDAGKAKWTIRNIAHGPESHVAVALRGNSLRVGALMTIYLADGNSSYPFTLWPSSYTVDLDTLSVALDNPEFFPLKIDADGVYFATGDELRTYAQPSRWPYSGANNTTKTYPGEGNVFWSFVDNTDQYSPSGIARSIPTGNALAFYDYLEAHNRVGYTQQDFWTLDGGVGSVFKPGQSGAVYLGNNAYLFTPVNQSAAIYVEVDPTTRYSPDYGGLGPSNVRRAFDVARYYKLGNMPWCASGNLQGGKLNGAYWVAPGSQNYLAVGDTPTADVLTISQSDWNVLLNTIESQAPAGAANGFAYEYINAATSPLFSVWAIRPKDAQPIWLAQVAVQSVRNGRKYIDYYLFQIYPSVSGSAVSFPVTSIDLVFFNTREDPNLLVISVTDYQNHTQRYGQPIFYEKGDGTGFLHIPNALANRVVGGAGSQHFEMAFTLSGGKLVRQSAGLVASAYYYNPSELSICGSKLARVGLYNISAAYVAGPAGTPDAYIAGGAGYVSPDRPMEIIAGVKTAEGWNFYMTEDTAWRVGSNKYTVPAYTVDLKAAFPGNYQNRTFYVHVVLTGQVPSYQLLSSRQKDTDTRLFLGTITTDNERITGIALEKVKRLGGLKQLTEHAGSAYRHSLDVDVDFKLSGLGLLRKQALAAPDVANTNAYLDSEKVLPLVTAQGRTDRPRLPSINKPVRAFAPGEVGNRADVFFGQASSRLAMNSENNAAYAAGMYWIGTMPPFTPATYVNWRAMPRVTPTKGVVRVRLYLPAGVAGASSTVKVNGVSATVPHGGTAYVDLPVTVGKLLQVSIDGYIDVAGLARWDESWFAFGIYDFDGTTETALAVSNSNTPAIYYSNDNDYVGCVIVAEEIDIGVSTSDYYPIVSAGNCSVSPMVKYTPGQTTIIVATKWVSMNGLETATDLAVNLMPRL